MIYRKIVGDVTVEYEGTLEEIRGVLDREDKPMNATIINPTVNVSSKDISTNELVEELSKRTGVKIHRVGIGGTLIECNEMKHEE